MSCIVAEISQEVQEIFQALAGDASVSIGDVEKRVSVAVLWGQRLSEAILSETSGSAESPVSVRCPLVKARVAVFGEGCVVLEAFVVFCSAEMGV